MFLNPAEAWRLLLICAGIVAGFLLYAHLSKIKQKVPLFYCWLGAIAVLGGAVAFFLPIAVNSGFAKDDDGSALRQALLYTTGGVLGVITLGETHRKNNQEKEKNENDHIRQVHAERRSRYAKAIEQLADNKASIRLGGIYTLVGLVDEWLDDNKTLSDSAEDSNKRKEEGQVIINNLCSYIRSPFPLAAKIEEYEAHKKLEELKKKESENTLIGAEPFMLKALSERFTNTQHYKKPEDITTDYAQFHEEQDVRRTIFVEMSKRSSTFTRDENNKVIDISPGMWSDFDFDFSRAPIFYPLNNLTIERADFNLANFYGRAEFYNVTFVQDAGFILATFACDADFRKATFIRDADFDRADFICDTDFSEATFSISVDFTKTTFTYDANFSKTIFAQDAIFSGATFNQNVSFSEATFKTYKPFFAQWGEVRTRFSIYADPQKHNFKTRQDSQPIPLGKAELDDVEHIIPEGAVLFNPKSWDDKTQDHPISEPAMPLENSDTEE
ncbi:MAG: pentapeptide repeat-containing protein [Rothia dentocariosa]|jgi:uncharacterized low-complexity protein|uniref:Pentapeptide repeat-containing protein n=1 Tax=Rothia dentocariosa TaxID=2047 RepID=A0A930KMG9_9MICC|nr:pentapeptide repeat-containing protein [Rothia dentocariosa]